MILFYKWGSQRPFGSSTFAVKFNSWIIKLLSSTFFFFLMMGEKYSTWIHERCVTVGLLQLFIIFFFFLNSGQTKYTKMTCETDELWREVVTHQTATVPCVNRFAPLALLFKRRLESLLFVCFLTTNHWFLKECKKGLKADV